VLLRGFRGLGQLYGEAERRLGIEFLDQIIPAFAQAEARCGPLRAEALQHQKIISPNDIQQDVLALALHFGRLAPSSPGIGRFLLQAVQARPILAFIANLCSRIRGHGHFDEHSRRNVQKNCALFCNAPLRKHYRYPIGQLLLEADKATAGDIAIDDIINIVATLLVLTQNHEGIPCPGGMTATVPYEFIMQGNLDKILKQME